MGQIVKDSYGFAHWETTFQGRLVWIDTFSTKLTIFKEVAPHKKAPLLFVVHCRW